VDKVLMKIIVNCRLRGSLIAKDWTRSHYAFTVYCNLLTGHIQKGKKALHSTKKKIKSRNVNINFLLGKLRAL